MRNSIFILGLITVFSLKAQSESKPDYMRLVPSCQTCTAIDRALAQFHKATDSNERMGYVMDIAEAISNTHLKDKERMEQKRAIYFALYGTQEVQTEDFDSETTVRLMDLRGQSPSTFDEVFWRFPTEFQQKIVDQMQGFKEDHIRSKAPIPQVKALK